MHDVQAAVGAVATDPACRLRFRAVGLPAERGVGVWTGSGRRRHSCLDGGSRWDHDAGGHEPRDAWTYWAAIDRNRRHAIDLRRHHCRGPGADLRGGRSIALRIIAVT